MTILDEIPVRGGILSDQVKSLDWIARDATVIRGLPVDTVQTVLGSYRRC